MKLKHLITASACMVALGSQAALVGYWDFEDASTTTLLDGSGNGNMATVQSGGTLGYSTDTPFSSGSSLSLDGTAGTSAQALSSASLSVAGDLTLVAWIKPITSADVSMQILSKNTGAYRWRIQNINTGNGNFNNRSWIQGGQSTQVFAGSTDWIHIAVVLDDATNTKTTYRNGVLLQTTTGVATLLAGTANLQIGANGTTEVFNGLMDDVAIYSSTLSATQIGQLVDGSRDPITVIPEPATLGLIMGAGVLLIGARRFMI